MMTHVFKGRKVPNMLIDPFFFVMYFVTLRLSFNLIPKLEANKYCSVRIWLQWEPILRLLVPLLNSVSDRYRPEMKYL